ncbi:MAG TPA: ORF6N domain-containing protein [Nitrospiraceae bacterium]|nr:ORF6N domain-containing protein [Nitrospiraceae bacterium]
MTTQEFEHLKSQIAISSSKWGGRRHAPYAVTEQGVAMRSSVLRSKRAIQVNIAIMRAFVQLREMIASNKGLARQLICALVGRHLCARVFRQIESLDRATIADKCLPERSSLSLPRL